MNPDQRKKRLQLQKARVQFLKDHPELWNKDKKTIVNEMKKAGVVSKLTYFADVRVEKTIQELRYAKISSDRRSSST